MADYNSLLDKDDHFLVGFNVGRERTRHRAPSAKQTCTGGAPSSAVLREASNVMTTSSTGKVSDENSSNLAVLYMCFKYLRDRGFSREFKQELLE